MNRLQYAFKTNPFNGNKNALQLRLLISAVLAIACNYYVLHSHLGVDLTDESFTLAMAHRFALGDTPFRQEFAIHQTSALIYMPLVYVYEWINGGPAGIVLFTRIAFLLFNLLVSTLLAASVFSITGFFGAFFISAIFSLRLMYPFANFNYNSLSLSFTALALIAAGRSRERLGFWWCGAAAALSAVAYPTFILWIALLPLILIFANKHANPKFRLQWAFIGLMSVFIPYAAVLLLGGVENIQAAFAAHQVVAPKLGTVAKLARISLFLWNLIPLRVFVPLILLATIARLKPQWSKTCLCITFAAVFFLFSRRFFLNGELLDYHNWGNALATWTLATPLFWLYADARPYLNRLFLQWWLPGFLLGFATAFTSSDGHNAFVIGNSIGLIATAATPWILLRENKLEKIALVAAVPILVLFLIGHNRFINRDSVATQLNTTITQGPFAGIKTSADKVQLISSLQQDLERLVPQNAAVFFFDDFPAGYLMSKRPVTSYSAWVFTRKGSLDFRRVYVDGLQKMGYDKIYFIEMKRNTRDPEFRLNAVLVDDPIRNWMTADRCEKVYEKAGEYGFQLCRL